LSDGELVPQERTPPEILTAGALLGRQFPPIVWTVPGLLMRGSCDLLAGKAKAGKSRFALGLGWAIATGGPALGSIPVVAGDVLYLALEDGQRRLQGRLMQISGYTPGDGEPPDYEHFHTSSEWSPIDEGGLEFIDGWMSDVANPTLVIVDTLKRIKPYQSSKKQIYDNDYDALQPLSDLAHSRDVGILVVHHTRKADAEDWLDEISGSTGTTAAVDGAIILKRKRGAREGTLFVVNRDAPEDLQLALVADFESGGWVYAGDAEAITLSQARLEVLNVLISVGRPMKTGDIAGAVGKQYTAVTNMLYRMIPEGLVIRTDWGAFSAAPDAVVRLQSKVENTGVNGVNGVNGSGTVWRQKPNSSHLHGLHITHRDSDDSDVPF
jgi:hypothetical protein